jgi:uncharacterized protein YndB with AHSA1/START domain
VSPRAVRALTGTWPMGNARVVTTLGQLREAGGRWELAFVRTLPQPPETVWRALTEPAQLSAWFPASIEGERRAGAPLRFVFPGDDGPPLTGEMLTYAPPAVLELRWETDVLRFELEPDGDGTVLTLLNTFDEQGKAARDGAGWHACLDVLEHELAGEDPPWLAERRWEQLHASYVETLGPEASTIGPPD